MSILKSAISELGLEAIDFDKSMKYRNEIIKLFGEIKIARKEKKSHATVLNEIIKLVKSEFGLNVALIDRKDEGPYIHLPTINSNNVAFSTWMNKEIMNEDIIRNSKKHSTKMSKEFFNKRKKDVIKGEVDFKRHYVTGDLQDPIFTCRINLGTFLFDHNVSPAELAGAFTHELGHMFYYLGYMYAQRNINIVLNEFNKGFLNIPEKKVKYQVLKNAKSAGFDLGDSEEAIARSENNEVMTSIILAQMEKNLEAETGYSVFNHTTSEKMADHFAARMGLGTEVSDFLVKAAKDVATFRYTAFALRNTFIGLYIAYVGFVYGAAIASLGSTLLISTMVTMLDFTVLRMMESSGFNPHQYPTLKRRLENFMEQEIAKLNDSSWTKEEKKEILVNIRQIQAGINDLPFLEKIDAVMNEIYYKVWRSNYKDFVKDEQAQADLEKLVNSRMGEVAAIIETGYKG